MNGSIFSSILILQMFSFTPNMLKTAAPLTLRRSRGTQMPGVPAAVTPGCTCTTVSKVYVLSLDDGAADSREKIVQLSLSEDGQTCVHAPQEAERFLPAEAFVLVK